MLINCFFSGDKCVVSVLDPRLGRRCTKLKKGLVIGMIIIHELA